MSTIASQHHFRRLNLLMRHLATSAANAAPGEQAGTDGQSKPDTDSALPQSTSMPTIVQLEAPQKAAVPTMGQEEQHNWLQGLCSQIYKLHIRRGRPVAHLCVRRIDIQADQR